jgi:hypothetical protein
LDDSRIYDVVTSGFLAKGYSGYKWFLEGAGRETLECERSIAEASLRKAVALRELDGRLEFDVDERCGHGSDESIRCAEGA